MFVQSVFHNVWNEVRKQERWESWYSVLIRRKRVVVFHQVMPLCIVMNMFRTTQRWSLPKTVELGAIVLKLGVIKCSGLRWFLKWTRRPASADRTARRQFQATGQPVSRTQASDAMTSRLPCYEAKCVQLRCFQCGSVPLRSDIKGTVLPPASILIPLKRQLIVLQLCRWQFLYNETLQQTFRPVLVKLSKRRQI